MNKKIINILESIPREFFGGNMYDEREYKAVKRVIKKKTPFRYYGNELPSETKKLEKKCSEYFNVKYAHAVNSGTGALSCALHALGVTIGDEVVVPGYFWISIVNMCIERGAIPILCDIDDSFNLDINDLESKISNKTKCVVVVHMDGAQAKIDEIGNLCKKHGILVLEDFSQCIGGKYLEKKIGGFGDISIASFQMNKMITAGEGGIILTNNEEYYKKVQVRSDGGYVRNDENSLISEKYITYGEGRRYNEISAAIMNVQLCKLENIFNELKNNKKEILNILGDIQPIKYRKIWDSDGEVCNTLMFIFPHKNDVNEFLDNYYKEMSNNELRIYRICDCGYHLYYNCKNIVNKIDYLPGEFPWKYVDASKYNYDKGVLKNADDLFERTIAVRLPCGMTRKQRITLAKTLKYFIIKQKEHFVNYHRK